MSSLTVYTVCTGHYQNGLFALVNSLIHYGFKGRIVVATDNHIDSLDAVPTVQQHLIETKHIFGNLKARVILEQPDDHFLYLDPDIIQTSRAFIPFIQKSISQHGRLVLSSEGIVPKHEVRRLTWSSTIKDERPILHDVYFSAGLVAGDYTTYKGFLQEWDNTINRFIAEGKYFNAHPSFPLADQDILNAIVQHMPESEVFSIGIPDWIGTAVSSNPFHPWGSQPKTLFVHATGKLKTWTINGIPMRYPNAYDKWYYRFRFGEDLAISSPQTPSFMQRMWFSESRLLPFYNKIRRIVGM